VLVGDGVQDVLAARGARIRCIAVLGGYADEDALRAAGADVFADAIGDLWRNGAFVTDF
jgi:phosphoglycolate phosphatase-like HAD superfamily hydrolase